MTMPLPKLYVIRGDAKPGIRPQSPPITSYSECEYCGFVVEAGTYWDMVSAGWDHAHVHFVEGSFDNLNRAFNACWVLYAKISGENIIAMFRFERAESGESQDL